ncbi:MULTISPECIES: hypothetical protein [unclassified Achromobacter]|uniref:hypothetical protein n=1 Tax=unclassified Achromobacter TaxID=2626865 RepID=UPI000B518216|nr:MULTISPECIES: hypothetical protein [unclassified Achromobacter]OWT68094.1 hypothetical protein CEY05_29100 [Achromobacter sp. HZ34]OWT69931.1 hypothetical protein CEY04_27930 [Achromobacter sp. HZ28]
MGDLVLDSDFTAPLRPITDYPTPLGDYLEAKVGQTLQGTLDTMSWLAGARPNRAIIAYDLEGNPVFGDDPSQVKVAPDEAKQRLGAAGVKLDVPEDGIYENNIQALIERQQDQVARQVAITASPTGARSVLGFGAQFATSLLDPINLAASFVPVVGPLKYSAMLADTGGALGRAGVRAGIGAAEGAAGAALLTPLQYAATRNAGDDFTMTDALENIAFGAAFGAGLHTIGGALKDSISGPPRRAPIETDVPSTLPENPATAADISTRAGQQPITVNLATGEVPAAPMRAAWIDLAASHDARIGATSTAIGQLLDGRNIEINPILRNDPNVQYALAQRGQPTDLAGATAQARADLEPQLRNELTALAGNQAERGQVAQMSEQLESIQRELARPAVPAKEDIRTMQAREKLKFKDAEARAQADVDSRRADLEGQAHRLTQALDTNRRASQAAQDLAALDKGEFPARYQDQLDQRAQDLMQGDPLTAALRQLYSTSPEADRAAAQRYNGPDNVAVADPDMARAADEHLAQTPEPLRAATAEGAEQAMNDAQVRFRDVLDNLKRQGATDETLAALQKELEPFDAAVKDADNLAAATRAAALCGLRNG